MFPVAAIAASRGASVDGTCTVMMDCAAWPSGRVGGLDRDHHRRHRNRHRVSSSG